jgi:hypothetical protein
MPLYPIRKNVRNLKSTAANDLDDQQVVWLLTVKQHLAGLSTFLESMSKSSPDLSFWSSKMVIVSAVLSQATEEQLRLLSSAMKLGTRPLPVRPNAWSDDLLRLEKLCTELAANLDNS